MIKRPMLWVFTAYAAGIFWGRLKGSGDLKPFFTGIFLFLFFSFFVFLSFKYQYLIFLFFLPALFFLGFFLVSRQTEAEFQNKPFFKKKSCQLTGIVGSMEQKENSTMLSIKKSFVKVKGTPESYELGTVLVLINTREDIRPGNEVVVTGELKELENPGNPGQFNEKLYYQSKNITCKMFGKEIKVTNSNYYVYSYWLFKIRQRFSRIYDCVFPKEDASLARAIILGDKSQMEEDQKRLYEKNGIAHILAISGLHISLIGNSLLNFLKKSGIPLFAASILVILLILSYGLMTGPGISTFRAVVMLILAQGAVVIGRTYDTCSAASLAGFLILLKEPLVLFQSGFLLSFGAVFAILFCYPAIYQEFLSLIHIKKIKSSYLEKLIQAFLLSLTIQIVTLPVILSFYYEFPPYSTILNFIILPFMPLVLMLCLSAGIAGCLSILAGSFFAGGVHVILSGYEMLCKAFSLLPGSSLVVGKPEWIGIIGYYTCFLVFCFLRWREKIKNGKDGWESSEKKRHFFLLAGLFLLFFRFPHSQLQVTFLDVGQGDGIVLETPGGSVVTIDGGSSDVKELGKYRLIPFLKSKGITRIDYAWITHGDQDHISGIMELIEHPDIRVQYLILPDITPNREDPYKKLAQLAEKNHAKVAYASQGQMLLTDGVKFQCLYPKTAMNTQSRNDHSLVLDVAYGSFRMLLTGDLEAKGEEDVGEYVGNNKRRYDVLKVAHHGSGSSTKDAFLEIIMPQIAVISCGKNNSYGHPHKEVVDRLKNKNCSIYTTVDCGAIIIHIDGRARKVEKFKKQE